jgi:predicted MFS family arabinose efflux permease
LVSDLHRIYAVQAVRAFVYGFGSVVLGASLERAGFSGVRVGLIFAALLAGSALVSLTLVRRADRVGRRRLYAALLAGMGVSGTIFALTDSFPLLLLAALTGTLSVEVLESGPFTSIEQAMLPATAEGSMGSARAFGTYNAIAALVGSAGALAAGGPEVLRRLIPNAPASQRWLLLYPLAAAVALAFTRGLSPAVEAGRVLEPGPALRGSRKPVLRLAGLFAVDSFAGGFVVQSFVVFWFAREFGASTELMGVVLAGTGLLQAGSFVLAPRLALRFGLLNTMVFTHLPSNLLLALIPLAPNLPIALTLLLLRFPLSQMDVPTRQAYLTLLAGPKERAAAASVTNAARTAVRPLSAPIAGAATGTSLSGLPFFLAGGLKAIYDLALYFSFRRIPVDDERAAQLSSRVRLPPPG